MLKITCFNCHWSWSLLSEAAQAAYDSMKPGEKHYAMPCPRCGRVNKVAVSQLKRALPRAVEESPPDNEAQS